MLYLTFQNRQAQRKGFIRLMLGHWISFMREVLFGRKNTMICLPWTKCLFSIVCKYVLGHAYRLWFSPVNVRLGWKICATVKRSSLFFKSISGKEKSFIRLTLGHWISFMREVIFGRKNTMIRLLWTSVCSVFSATDFCLQTLVLTSKCKTCMKR